MTGDPKNDGEDVRAALEHAWNWFSLHATHRLQLVNFFLVATAFLSAAFVTASKEEMHVLAGAVAVLAVFMSYLFYRIERRIRSLVHAAENALQPLQHRIAESLDVDDLQIVSHVEEAHPGEWKYSKVFRYLYLTTGMAFVLGLFYAIWSTFSKTPDATAFKVVVQAVLGVFLIVVGHEMLVSLPKPDSQDNAKAVTRWSLIVLGIICVLSGVGTICHLVIARL